MRLKRIYALHKKKINDELYKLDNYHQFIPMGLIHACIGINDSVPYRLANEDGTDFEGVFCGRQGRADIHIAVEGKVVFNMLHLTWYKMASGRYEIVAYVS